MSINQQIEDWLIAHKNRFDIYDRPFVTLTYAQSLDGSIALRNDEPLALSGVESLALTHQLRSIHDGILVGIGTVISDNPQLTVRHWAGFNPQPIVLDSQLRMPCSARLCHLPDHKCWVLTTREDEQVESQKHLYHGIDITTLATDSDGRVCLQCALKFLRGKGIKSLMVEGGANVINAFLKAEVADALVLTVVPHLVGGYKAVNRLIAGDKSLLPSLDFMFNKKLGDDLVIWGRLRYADKRTALANQCHHHASDARISMSELNGVC